MPRSRRKYTPATYKCPYCTKPEKWLKNSSGLMQHINTVHIDLFREPSPPSSPPPIEHFDPVFPVDPHESSSDDHHGPGRGHWQRPQRRFALTPLEMSRRRNVTALIREFHLSMTDCTIQSPFNAGLPCDQNGHFLPEGTPPPPRTSAQSGDWSPFCHRIEFELAEFLYKTEQMSGKNINTLMALWAADVAQYGGEPPFADRNDLYDTIDGISHGDVPWQCLIGCYQGPIPDGGAPAWMRDEYEVWYRDPRQVAHRMLANPDFEDGFDAVPYREFTQDYDRRYSDYMSGNWSWQQADRITADHGERSYGAMFVPIILGSDKTTVSVATGQNDYYPLYMSIGNLHNNVRRAHRDSVVLIAFLAIPKGGYRYDNHMKFRRQLFHSSIAVILSSFKPGMTEPEVVRCPDAYYRKAVWGIGAYIADYPEQVIVSCIVQGWCPTCLNDSDELDTPEPGDKRSRPHTEALIRAFDPKVLWEDYGVVHDVVPFTQDFPRADVHELLSGDLLHQLIKGTFKDHLVTWVGEYLVREHGETRGKEILDEIDRRLALVPPFPGLRHFKQGRDFKQWTGDDSKALMKVYLPSIACLLPSRIVRTIAAFLEVCYIARRDVLYESDLQGPFHNARQQFHRERQVFKDAGVRPDGFSLPRQHSLDHYPQHIRNFGAPNGLCSSITEAKHIKAVKEPWRRSNRYEPLGQMLVTNQRLEKLSAARADFTARGMLTGTCLGDALDSLGQTNQQNSVENSRDLHEDVASSEDDPYVDPLDPNDTEDEDEEHLDEPSFWQPGEQHDDGSTNSRSSNRLQTPESDNNDAADGNGVVQGPRVNGYVVLPRKHKHRYPRYLEDLGEYINVPDLAILVSRFLFQQDNPDAEVPDDTVLPTAGLRSYRVRVYHSAIATFYAPSDPSGIGGMHREHIRATPSWRKGPPRYDCVFIGKDPHEVGFRSLHAARVRLFFSVLLPARLDSAQEWVPCALVEWFSEVGDEPDEDTGLWVVEPDLDASGGRVRDVVHIQTLLRAAHLIPVFGPDPTPPHIQQHEVLDSYRAFYVNKYADHHAHEIAF
ncbi:hypothetical protein C8Q77DRAFT_1280491 [Trametes polyzona]|nr:hypothetical protein C8Q77DRAFT_1280491 [Trametes polyzona]